MTQKQHPTLTPTQRAKFEALKYVNVMESIDLCCAVIESTGTPHGEIVLVLEPLTTNQVEEVVQLIGCNDAYEKGKPLTPELQQLYKDILAVVN